MKLDWLFGVFIVVVCVLVSISFVKYKPPEHIFGDLQIGQKVTLKEMGGGYEIHVIENLPPVAQGFKITKIQNDLIILEDVAGITEVRIPIYAVKSVKVVRLPNK
jgi:hypothetical protein